MSDALNEQVQVSSDARTYVQERGGALMLRSTLKHGCCGGRVELVKADPGRPRSDRGFRRIDLDGVTLFVEEGLLEELDQPLRVGLDRLMGLRSLFVEGATTRM